jgi:GNAT superfamily N-acetyltransferase
MGSCAEIHDDEAVNTTAPAPLPPSELPASSSSTISLLPATPLERFQCWHINSRSWRAPLSAAQYLSREAFLGRQLLTQDGNISYWILTDTCLSHGKDGARPILASCETLRKDGYLASHGHVEKVVTHGIGSVFCRPEYRGRGYASRMMTELAKRLETWQQPKGSEASFSMLWSDIGTSFYACHGWKAMPSAHISLPMASDEISFQLRDQQVQLDCSHLHDLNAQDLQTRVCPEAIASLEAKIRLQSEQRPGVPQIAIRPNYEHMQWHHAREEFQARALFDKEPYIKGVEDTATGCALIWSRTWGESSQKNKIHVLHTMVPLGADGDVVGSIAALLLRAQLEAKTWDMGGGVEIWSPEPTVIEAAQSLAGKENVQIKIRDKESVCSLRYIASQDEEVDWVANERYAWC